MVYNLALRRYAHETKEAALDALLARKKKQIAILEDNLMSAKESLDFGVKMKETIMAKSEVLWITTFTGKHVNPMHLEEEDIDIVDIAHSLSLQCRFLGHCKEFYSVAEHSILVADIVHKELYGKLPRMGVVTSLHSITQEYLDNSCLTALLHDAAEAYIGDIARPIKHSHIFKYIPEIEQQILGKIGNKFGLGGADWALIKKADNIMLATEAKALMKDIAP